jgi:hypothetical protein
MTDTRPRRRSSPFDVDARVTELEAITGTLLPCLCLTLTRTSHCIALANIAVDLVAGQRSFLESRQLRTNPLWCVH